MELKALELNGTVEMMNSTDYKERFKAECLFLKAKYNGLTALLQKWDAGTLDFTPDCPRRLYDVQFRAMGDYLAILEARAKMERVELEDG